MLNKTLIIGIIILLIGINYSTIYGNSKGADLGISLITVKVSGVTGGIENWYGNDNSFNFSYESDEIAEIYYGINGNLSLYNDTFNVTISGDHILEWYAIDHVGNKSEIDGPFYFKVDKTPPDIDLYYEVVGGNPLQGWDFEFTACAIDTMSGMDRVEFYLNNVVQETVSGPGPDYKWTVRYWPIPNARFWAKAFDKAGNSDWDDIIEPSNIAVLRSSVFNKDIDEERGNNCCLDVVLPSITTERKNHRDTDKMPSGDFKKNVFDPAYILIEYNREYGKNGWIVSEVSIPILYESDRVDEVYYQINNSGWILYTEPLIISEDGTYDFSWYVIDSEGHTSTIDSIPTFKVDLTPPEINLAQERISINKVKFNAEVYDETSGIEKVRFKSSLSWFIDYDYPYEWIWYGFLRDKVTVTVYDNASNINSQSMTTSRVRNYAKQSSILLFLRFLERFSFLKRMFPPLI